MTMTEDIAKVMANMGVKDIHEIMHFITARLGELCNGAVDHTLRAGLTGAAEHITEASDILADADKPEAVEA